MKNWLTHQLEGVGECPRVALPGATLAYFINERLKSEPWCLERDMVWNVTPLIEVILISCIHELALMDALTHDVGLADALQAFSLDALNADTVRAVVGTHKHLVFPTA